MGETLTDIAIALKDSVHITKATNKKTNDIKAHLIYAFNGTGKTRLSRVFKNQVISEISDKGKQLQLTRSKILYYNAFTEDLFFWDNDLKGDIEYKLKIQPNSYTDWLMALFQELGEDGNIIKTFQRYTNNKLTPKFNPEYTMKMDDGREVLVKAFSEISFSLERGDDDNLQNIKVSKGEESIFIWSIFNTLLEQVVDILNIEDSGERITSEFDELEYIFIDDPVSSLDENHLIELAANLADLIKSSKSKLKFIITTHNPIFYNVVYNLLRDSKKYKKYLLTRLDDGSYEIKRQNNDSPFAYHLFLKKKLEQAIEDDQIEKYHFNYLRNFLEKTSTFLGYENWSELLPKDNRGRIDPYKKIILEFSSHSKHASQEIAKVSENDKKILSYLVKEISKKYHFR